MTALCRFVLFFIYIKAKFGSYSGILVWAMNAGMEQSCNFLPHTITINVKWLHASSSGWNYTTKTGLQSVATPSKLFYFELLDYIQNKFQCDSDNLGLAMDAGMGQSCNFLIYTIIMERQNTLYIELRVKLHLGDGLKDGDSSLYTLFNLFNYIQTTFQSDLGILGWLVSSGIEKSCNFLLHSITIERQVSAYIELRVKLHHNGGLTDVNNPLPNSFLHSQLYRDQVLKRFRNFGVRYGCWNGAKTQLKIVWVPLKLCPIFSTISRLSFKAIWVF